MKHYFLPSSDKMIYLEAGCIWYRYVSIKESLSRIKVMSSFYQMKLDMESMSASWLFLYCGVFWRCALAFPPQAVLNEPETMSHSYITLVGIHRTAAEFLIKYHLVNNTDLSTTEIVKSFFGTGKVDKIQKSLVRHLVRNLIN